MPERRGAAAAWAVVGVWLLLQLAATSVPASSVPRLPDAATSVAHVALYGMLAFLVTRAVLRSGAPVTRLLAVWPVLVAFAALDEWHQRFIPGRVPSVGDLVCDALGAAAGLWLGAILLRTRWAVWLR